MSDIALQIINILAPGMLLATIGVVWFHKGSEFPVPFVTTLVISIAMPALLFHTLANSSIPVQSLATMAFATLLMHVMFGIGAVVLLKIGRKVWQLCVSHVVGNTGNLGLPVCYLAFGDEGLAYGMMFFAVQCLLLFSIGDAVIARRIDVKSLARSPILHAVWLGVLVRLLELELPMIASQTLQLLGQIVIPIMLITLGVSLAGMRASQLPMTLLWSIVRTLLAACVAVGVAQLLGMTGVARGVLILQTVMPVAVFNYLLAVKHGRDNSKNRQ